MGNENSGAKPFMAEPYIVLDANEDEITVSPKRPHNDGLINTHRLLSTGFSASYSMILPESVTPKPRTTHFMTYVPAAKSAVIGYGIDGDDNLLNDMWVLNVETRKWTQLNIDSSTVSPRNGTTACFIKDKIYLFGGFSGTSYLDDLHVLYLPTLGISRPATTGGGPAGRIGHIMASYQNKIMVWGGYNGDWLSDLWILDTDTMVWREVNSEINGRTSATYASHNDNLYIFGAAKSDALLKFNWTTEKLEVVKYTGSAPPPELSAASMVAVDRYLLLFGGKYEKRNFCLMYGFDTVRNWWFIFHVHPDGVTTNVSDGFVDRNGMFMVPRIWSASITYRKQTREVVLFLGAPLLEPPNIGIVSCGDALSVLHLQCDLYETFMYMSRM
ncbi:Kelch motif family protein [Tritrichomonas foetus]|uniref:Kelch motif family protein n=1 Tax=Tritrichomonas foetus TaxID=1144522 RepID=A0A1J4KKI8_9EUKA|nr:Kelch motif family protein [Tritrichomonas foetus]|eukprot:OHT11448.1 Kelch motif family protein [Tritrichomonas foetus]